MALLQLWMIGVDIVLGRGFTGAGGFNVAMFVLSVSMASSQSYKLHLSGTIAAWILFVGALVFRSLGVIV